MDNNDRYDGAYAGVKDVNALRTLLGHRFHAKKELSTVAVSYGSVITDRTHICLLRIDGPNNSTTVV